MTKTFPKNMTKKTTLINNMGIQSLALMKC